MVIGNGKLKAVFAGAFAVALCFTLAGCSGSSSSSAASASDSASGSSSATETAAEVASSSAASAASSASSASATAKSTSASQFPADAVDEHGNITVYAAIELTGPELASLLEAQGYQWDNANKMWLRSEDGASFLAVRELGQFSQSDYAAATDKGGAAVAISCSVVGGYKDVDAALKGNKKCVTVDSFSDGDSAIAIVYGPSMKEYLIIAQPYSESTVEIDIYSKEAVGSGMLDEVYGHQIGGSFQEVWKTFTGKDSYGH